MSKNLEIRQGRPPKEIFDTRTVVKTLERLMNDVTSKDCTPSTVNAACNCADKITDMLRLHLDVERLKARMNPRSNNEA
jgi:hypothetical protein